MCPPPGRLLEPGVGLRFPLPAVLSAAGFLLCLLAMAVRAGALPVGEVELVAAFCDGDDVVGFVDSSGASGAVDLAALVSRFDGAFPCGLLCTGGSPDGGVFGPVHGYSPAMGLKGFRERVLAKADALDARADRLDAEVAAARVEREAVQAEAKVDADLAWCRAEAARLGVDHDELVARAEPFGIPLPAPHRAGGFERVSTGLLSAPARVPGLGVLAALGSAGGDSEGSGGSRPDPYGAWVTLIRTEERVAAAGDGVSRSDLALLRMARWAFKHS